MAFLVLLVAWLALNSLHHVSSTTANSCDVDEDKLFPCGDSIGDTANSLTPVTLPISIPIFVDSVSTLTPTTKGGFSITDGTNTLEFNPEIGTADPVGNIFTTLINDNDELTCVSSLVSDAISDFDAQVIFRTSLPNVQHSDALGQNTYQLNLVSDGTRTYLLVAFVTVLPTPVTLKFGAASGIQTVTVTDYTMSNIDIPNLFLYDFNGDATSADFTTPHVADGARATRCSGVPDIAGYTITECLSLTYTAICAPGFLGLPSKITCDTSSSNWVPSEHCARQSCPEPTATTATFASGTYELDTSVLATCNPGLGFANEGVTSITCSLSSSSALEWQPAPDAICIADCGVPYASTTQSATFSDGPTVLGSTLDVICANGHDFADPSDTTIQCISGPTWSPSPEQVCSVLCPQPIADNTLFGDEPIVSGSTITATCAPGHEFSDPTITSSHCTNGAWNPVLENLCRPKDCGQPNAANTMVLSGTETTYQSVIVIGCLTGYSNANEPQALTCNADGTWSPAPEDCLVVNCMQPTQDSTVTLTGTTTTYRSTMAASCTPGHELIQGDVTGTMCEADGTWNPSVDNICQPKDCGELPEILLVEIENYPTTYPSAYDVTCASGWRLTDENTNTVMCVDGGTWSPEPQTMCQRIVCEFPAAISSAAFLGQSNNYLAELNITCFPGYVLSDENVNSVICGEDGTWSPNPDGVCVFVDCMQPMEDITVTLTGTTTTYGSTMEATCTAGHELILGDVTETMCEADGTWNPSVDNICQPKDCGELPEMLLVEMPYNLTTYPSAYDVTCAPGWRLTDENIRRVMCADGGTWSPEPQTMCQRIICEFPAPVESAAFLGQSNTFLSRLNITCYPGYVLSDENVTSLVCGEDGTWSVNPADVCIPVDCEQPELLDGVSVELTSTEFMATASVNCMYGYAQTQTPETSVITCESDGEWRPNLAVFCEVNECGAPPTADNAILISTNGSSSNLVLEYQCAEGMTTLEKEVLQLVQCDRSGAWTLLKPCFAGCATAPILLTADLVLSSGSAIGDTAVYSCKQGYIGAQQNLACLGDGVWSPTPVECQLESGTLVRMTLDLTFTPELADASSSEHYSLCRRLYLAFSNQLPQTVTSFICTFSSGSTIATMSFIGEERISLLDESRSYLGIKDYLQNSQGILTLNGEMIYVTDLTLVGKKIQPSGQTLETQLDIYDPCAIYEFENVCPVDQPCDAVNGEPICRNVAITPGNETTTDSTNNYLWMFVGLGILGFLVLLGLCFYFLWRRGSAMKGYPENTPPFIQEWYGGIPQVRPQQPTGGFSQVRLQQPPIMSHPPTLPITMGRGTAGRTWQAGRRSGWQQGFPQRNGGIQTLNQSPY